MLDLLKNLVLLEIFWVFTNNFVARKNQPGKIINSRYNTSVKFIQKSQNLLSKDFSFFNISYGKIIFKIFYFIFLSYFVDYPLKKYCAEQRKQCPIEYNKNKSGKQWKSN